ncbi:MAG: YgjP-like metallopeptidase domain-containing protein, partial [Pacificimonas sp.]
MTTGGVIPNHIETGGRSVPVILNRSARARRISILADGAGGVVRLTVPRRASLAKAARFLRERGDWIAEKVAAYPERRPFANGLRFPFEGDDIVIRHDVSLARKPVLANGILAVGGPAQYLPNRIERWLRAEALTRLKEDTEIAARRGGLSARLGRVSVRDTRRQWGSCTIRNGNIGYSWRLVCAPPLVR